MSVTADEWTRLHDHVSKLIDGMMNSVRDEKTTAVRLVDLHGADDTRLLMCDGFFRLMNLWTKAQLMYDNHWGFLLGALAILPGRGAGLPVAFVRARDQVMASALKENPGLAAKGRGTTVSIAEMKRRVTQAIEDAKTRDLWRLDRDGQFAVAVHLVRENEVPELPYGKNLGEWLETIPAAKRFWTATQCNLGGNAETGLAKGTYLFCIPAISEMHENAAPFRVVGGHDMLTVKEAIAELRAGKRPPPQPTAVDRPITQKEKPARRGKHAEREPRVAPVEPPPPPIPPPPPPPPLPPQHPSDKLFGPLPSAPAEGSPQLYAPVMPPDPTPLHLDDRGSSQPVAPTLGDTHSDMELSDGWLGSLDSDDDSDSGANDAARELMAMRTSPPRRSKRFAGAGKNKKGKKGKPNAVYSFEDDD